MPNRKKTGKKKRPYGRVPGTKDPMNTRFKAPGTKDQNIIKD